jgi:diacylglycerol kinase (ATP)
VPVVDHESKHDEAAPDAPPSIGFGRVINAWNYSIDGLAGAWRTEGAFRQEVICAAILIPIACLVPVPILERGLLIAAVLMVIVVELLNSAMEAAIDRISLDRHPLSKKAKDTGSAAVLVAIVIAMLVWGAVLFPHLLG